MNSKNVIVTGSSRGIGQEVALEFAKAGCNLVINSRNADVLSASKEEILKAIDGSTEIVTFTGDISQENVCKGLMDAAEKKLGGLDVLVNNAGINGPGKNIVDISSTEWDKVLDINLKGSFFCSREAIKKNVISDKKARLPRLFDYQYFICPSNYSDAISRTVRCLQGRNGDVN